MRIRRCVALFVEPREEAVFDLESLLAGSAGLNRSIRWLALAPHLDVEVEVSGDERELLGTLGSGEWIAMGALPSGSRNIAKRLLEVGLIIGDGKRHAVHRERDEAVGAGHWWPASILAQRFGRWQGVDSVQSMEDGQTVTAADVREKLGAPPSAVAERVPSERRVSLPRRSGDEFSALLARRATCRNFDARPLSRDLFAQMLERVFSAQAQVRVSDDTVFLKKTSPSGGGLHATEAYLIVQNVAGVAPGLYHYHPIDHALEPLSAPQLPLDEFARLALAGQHWFANAPALVVLTPRFARSFWKYRHHAKAYRALILDSGHLSQTLYLSATEMGLGAFVTSAINEIDIEQAFGLDPLEEGPLAICGFGWRAERMETTEFDPAGEVWEAATDES